MNNKNSKKPIKNVVCDVISCAYHDGESHCTANQLSIGPIHAESCTDTVCATYKPIPKDYESYGK